ncbi:molybdate transport system regulatory protein [Methylobacterium phyllostachyos]|uniref:Molybdate transport system regulatory protein n=1 Tax=Methylobacterium phyllostachyos TaxID=582672 RepID=A0A1G9V5D8_9HYPH|nr:molybdate transport system regulatory protein [Methylobacterium phyllostachyos]
MDSRHQGDWRLDEPNIRLRVELRTDILLGPGKADLLQGIRETGSIAAAGRRMGMSYKRAWYLIDTLNGAFRDPLVTANKGGRTGGGAQLTPMGDAVLDAYRRMETAATKAVTDDLAQLTGLLKPPV